MVGKYGVPRMLGAGAPCQDHTKCRLLPARFKSDIKEVKRPGFAGEKGKVFTPALGAATDTRMRLGEPPRECSNGHRNRHRSPQPSLQNTTQTDAQGMRWQLAAMKKMLCHVLIRY